MVSTRVRLGALALLNTFSSPILSVLWDSDGVSVYFFPRNSIPDDIEAGAPQPTEWGTPMAFWAAASCNPFEFFYTHTAIFDTTLWYVPLIAISIERKLIWY